MARHAGRAKEAFDGTGQELTSSHTDDQIPCAYTCSSPQKSGGMWSCPCLTGHPGVMVGLV